MKHLFKSSPFCVLLASILFAGCSPKLYTSIQQIRPPREASAPVAVYGIQELCPDSALLIGSIQIKDTGFSTNCGYNQVMQLALNETNRAGGNGFQITYHGEPHLLGSTCHRINGNILQLPESNIENHWTVSPAATAVMNKPQNNAGGKRIHTTIYLNAGYAFVISKMELAPNVTGNPKQGLDINGGISFTSRMGFGGGFRFSSYGNTLHSEGMPLQTHLNYYAPEFVMQQVLRNRLVLRETIGIGYANYTEKWNTSKASIGGLGTHITFAAEYKIIPEIGIGAEMGIYSTRFSSKNNFMKPSDEHTATGINRISLSGGVRFYF